MKPISKQSPLLIGLVVAIILTLILRSCDDYMSIKWGQDIESSNWMPEGASSGAFAKGGSFMGLGPPTYFYEYNISEQDIISYLKSKNWDYAEIDEARYIHRYLRYFSDPFRIQSSIDTPERLKSSVGITVTNGIYYFWSEEDASYHVIYDRDLERAFIEFHSR